MNSKRVGFALVAGAGLFMAGNASGNNPNASVLNSPPNTHSEDFIFTQETASIEDLEEFTDIGYELAAFAVSSCERASLACDMSVTEDQYSSRYLTIESDLNGGAKINIIVPYNREENEIGAAIEVNTKFNDGTSQLLSVDLIDANPNAKLAIVNTDDTMLQLGVSSFGSYYVSYDDGGVVYVKQSFTPEIAVQIRNGIVADIREQIGSIITGESVDAGWSEYTRELVNEETFFENRNS